MTAEELENRTVEQLNRDIDVELRQMHKEVMELNETPYPAVSNPIQVPNFSNAKRGPRHHFARASNTVKFHWYYKEFALLLHIRGYDLGTEEVNAAMNKAEDSIPMDVKMKVHATFFTDEHQSRTWGETFLTLMQQATPFCREEEVLIETLNKHLEAEARFHEDEFIVQNLMETLRENSKEAVNRFRKIATYSVFQEQHGARLKLAEWCERCQDFQEGIQFYIRSRNQRHEEMDRYLKEFQDLLCLTFMRLNEERTKPVPEALPKKTEANPSENN
jgi:hypothetical protein